MLKRYIFILLIAENCRLLETCKRVGLRAGGRSDRRANALASSVRVCAGMRVAPLEKNSEEV